MNVTSRQGGVFAKTTLKASTVRGSSFLLQLDCVFSVTVFQAHKKMPGCTLIFFRCKPGFFNLESSNPRGCTPCFCYGHSSVCTNAVGYSVYSVTSTFQTGNLDLFFCLQNVQLDVQYFLKISNSWRIFLMVATLHVF